MRALWSKYQDTSREQGSDERRNGEREIVRDRDRVVLAVVIDGEGVATKSLESLERVLQMRESEFILTPRESGRR